MANNLVKLISDGFAEEVLISQDRYCGMRGPSLRCNPTDEPDKLERMKAAGEWRPSHAYLFRTVLPMLRAGSTGTERDFRPAADCIADQHADPHSLMTPRKTSGLCEHRQAAPGWVHKDN